MISCTMLPVLLHATLPMLLTQRLQALTGKASSLREKSWCSRSDTLCTMTKAFVHAALPMLACTETASPNWESIKPENKILVHQIGAIFFIIVCILSVHERVGVASLLRVVRTPQRMALMLSVGLKSHGHGITHCCKQTRSVVCRLPLL